MSQTGAGGFWGLFRATWPLARFEATRDEAEISICGFATRVARRDIAAIEFRRGAWRQQIWLVPNNRPASSVWFAPFGLDQLLWQLSMLGWPIRERAR